MASIHEKKDSPYWWASYRDAQDKQHSKSTRVLRVPQDPALVEFNRDLAQQRADGFEQRAKAGLPVEQSQDPAQPVVDGVPVFKVFIGDWMQSLPADPKYRAKIEGYMENISLYLGPKVEWQICHLHHPDFMGLVPFLLQMKYSPTTVTFHLKALRAAFLVAENKGYILASPITVADYVANPKPICPDALSVPQITHLVNSTAVIDWRTTILFGFYTAMDLVEATDQVWPNIDFTRKTITWAGFEFDGEPCTMTLPLHPVLEGHLVALKKVSTSEFLTPKLHGVSDSALRVNFQEPLQESGLKIAFRTSNLGKDYAQFQFSSLKLAFARHVGHQRLFRLSRFLRGLAPEELEALISKLPSLSLKPLPLLGGA